MAKKCIGEMTFSEFSSWSNDRACDGKWSMSEAASCSIICTEIYSINPLFGKKQAREAAWNVLKKLVLNTDTVLDI